MLFRVHSLLPSLFILVDSSILCLLHLPFGRKSELWKAFAFATALIALLAFSRSKESQTTKESINRLTQDVNTLQNVFKAIPETKQLQKQTDNLLQQQQQQVNQLQTVWNHLQQLEQEQQQFQKIQRRQAIQELQTQKQLHELQEQKRFQEIQEQESQKQFQEQQKPRINYALSSLGAHPIHFLTTKSSLFTRQRAENALNSENEIGNCWSCGITGTFTLALPTTVNG